MIDLAALDPEVPRGLNIDALSPEVEGELILSNKTKRGRSTPFDLDATPRGFVPLPSTASEEYLAQYSEFGLLAQENADMRGLIADRDGLPVPETFRHLPERWYEFNLTVRKKLAESFIDQWWRQRQKQIAEEKKLKLPGAAIRDTSKFTTDYAKAYGIKRGWTYKEREWFDQFGRTHDLQFGMDLRFIGTNGTIMVQAAGKGQRAAHYERFIQRGGIAEAKLTRTEIYYWEFVRDARKPVLEERWA